MAHRLVSVLPTSLPTSQPDDVSLVDRLRRAAWAYTTRRVQGPLTVRDGTSRPKAGDLFLARVDSVGYHSSLQLPDGRRKRMFVGDEIVVAYGNRYAPSQFEAVVPKTQGPCQLVASGGVGAKVLSWHASVSKEPTQITPIGWLAGPGDAPANLSDYALPIMDRAPGNRPPTMVVVGTSMDSGKTQTAAFLVKGLSLAGLKVGFAKVTGTGAGGDTWLLRDAGADPVLDFTDVGHVSTYLVSPAEIQRAFSSLIAHLIAAHVEAIVIEVADGLLQPETAALLQSDVFRESVDGILFASGDAMGAVAGERWLRTHELPLVALSGVMTSSPLLSKEASKATGLPVFSRSDLARGKTALGILSLIGRPSESEPPSTEARRNGGAADHRVLVAPSYPAFETESSNGGASPEPRPIGSK